MVEQDRVISARDKKIWLQKIFCGVSGVILFILPALCNFFLPYALYFVIGAALIWLTGILVINKTK